MKKEKFVKGMIIMIIGAIFCFSLVSIHQAHAINKIGVLAKRGAPKCMKKWGATGAYISKKLGEKFQIIPLKFVAIEPAVRSGRIDFLLANPAFYVQLQRKYHLYAITTLINSRRGKAVERFGGVIFTKKDSPINKLQDIKGKRFMCVKFSSFGGFHMAYRLLLENGIDPKRDCRLIEGGKHDNVVLAVKNGTVDIGTVRTDTLERMRDEGRISLSEFKIIHKINDDFPFVHSTRLYPEWPFAALPDTDRGVVAKVKKALLSLPKESKAANVAKIVGWTEPADYSEVENCLRKIGIIK